MAIVWSPTFHLTIVKGNCFWKSSESVGNTLLLLLKPLSIGVACTHQARGGIQFRE